ncbi:hypothetical protein GQR58_009400 [Nymphon striatum]|nr:hypothetical protein GQR58_009400 [Nymphon striatum]
MDCGWTNDIDCDLTTNLKLDDMHSSNVIYGSNKFQPPLRNLTEEEEDSHVNTASDRARVTDSEECQVDVLTHSISSSNNIMPIISSDISDTFHVFSCSDNCNLNTENELSIGNSCTDINIHNRTFEKCEKEENKTYNIPKQLSHHQTDGYYKTDSDTNIINAPSQLMNYFNDCYSKRLEEATKSSINQLDLLERRVQILQSYVSDLKTQNEFLTNTLEGLEQETNKRVELLQHNLLKTADASKEYMDRVCDYEQQMNVLQQQNSKAHIYIKHLETEAKLKFNEILNIRDHNANLEHDIQSLISIIHNARRTGTWQIDNVTFCEVSFEEVYGDSTTPSSSCDSLVKSGNYNSHKLLSMENNNLSTNNLLMPNFHTPSLQHQSEIPDVNNIENISKEELQILMMKYKIDIRHSSVNNQQLHNNLLDKHRIIAELESQIADLRHQIVVKDTQLDHCHHNIQNLQHNHDIILLQAKGNGRLKQNHDKLISCKKNQKLHSEVSQQDLTELGITEKVKSKNIEESSGEFTQCTISSSNSSVGSSNSWSAEEVTEVGDSGIIDDCLTNGNLLKFASNHNQEKVVGKESLTSKGLMTKKVQLLPTNEKNADWLMEEHIKQTIGKLFAYCTCWISDANLQFLARKDQSFETDMSLDMLKLLSKLTERSCDNKEDIHVGDLLREVEKMHSVLKVLVDYGPKINQENIQCSSSVYALHKDHTENHLKKNSKYSCTCRCTCTDCHCNSLKCSVKGDCNYCLLQHKTIQMSDNYIAQTPSSVSTENCPQPFTTTMLDLLADVGDKQQQDSHHDVATHETQKIDFVTRLKNMEEQLIKAKQEEESKSMLIEQLKDHIKTAFNELQLKNTVLLNVETKLDKVRQTNRNHERDLNDTKTQLQQANQCISHFENQIEEKDQEINELRENEENIQDQRRSIMYQCDERGSQLLVTEQDNSLLIKKLEERHLQVENLMLTIQNLQEAVVEEKKNVESLKSQMKQKDEKILKIQEDFDESQQHCTKCFNELMLTEEMVCNVKAENNLLNKEVQSLKTNLNKLIEKQKDLPNVDKDIKIDIDLEEDYRNRMLELEEQLVMGKKLVEDLHKELLKTETIVKQQDQDMTIAKQDLAMKNDEIEHLENFNKNLQNKLEKLNEENLAYVSRLCPDQQIQANPFLPPSYLSQSNVMSPRSCNDKKNQVSYLLYEEDHGCTMLELLFANVTIENREKDLKNKIDLQLAMVTEERQRCDELEKLCKKWQQEAEEKKILLVERQLQVKQWKQKCGVLESAEAYLQIKLSQVNQQLVDARAFLISKQDSLKIAEKQIQIKHEELLSCMKKKDEYFVWNQNLQQQLAQLNAENKLCRENVHQVMARLCNGERVLRGHEKFMADLTHELINRNWSSDDEDEDIEDNNNNATQEL